MYKNNKQKKYTYAVSMGKRNIAEWQSVYNLSDYLSDFKTISLREESSINSLDSIGISSQFDLDPLLMIEKEEWEKYVSPKHIKGKYICVYLVEQNVEALKFAIEYANANCCEVYYFGNPLKYIPNVKVKRFVGISEWLGYIKNANAIITNSYHGLAFCILFEKPFSYWNLRDRESSMRMLDLINRLNIDVTQDIVKPDWQRVLSLLTNERKKSIDYVKRIVGE